MYKCELAKNQKLLFPWSSSSSPSFLDLPELCLSYNLQISKMLNYLKLTPGFLKLVLQALVVSLQGNA